MGHGVPAAHLLGVTGLVVDPVLLLPIPRCSEPCGSLLATWREQGVYRRKGTACRSLA
jgi:hypothetical protein